MARTLPNIISRFLLWLSSLNDSRPMTRAKCTQLGLRYAIQNVDNKNFFSAIYRPIIIMFSLLEPKISPRNDVYFQSLTICDEISVFGENVECHVKFTDIFRTFWGVGNTPITFYNFLLQYIWAVAKLHIRTKFDDSMTSGGWALRTDYAPKTLRLQKFDHSNRFLSCLWADLYHVFTVRTGNHPHKPSLFLNFDILSKNVNFR